MVLSTAGRLYAVFFPPRGISRRMSGVRFLQQRQAITGYRERDPRGKVHGLTNSAFVFGQPAIQRVAERLTVARVERGRATGVDAGAA